MKKLAPSTTYDQHCTYGGVDFLKKISLKQKIYIPHNIHSSSWGILNAYNDNLFETIKFNR